MICVVADEIYQALEKKDMKYALYLTGKCVRKMKYALLEGRCIAVFFSMAYWKRRLRGFKHT